MLVSGLADPVAEERTREQAMAEHQRGVGEELAGERDRSQHDQDGPESPPDEPAAAPERRSHGVVLDLDQRPCQREPREHHDARRDEQQQPEGHRQPEQDVHGDQAPVRKRAGDLPETVKDGPRLAFNLPREDSDFGVFSPSKRTSVIVSPAGACPRLLRQSEESEARKTTQPPAEE